MGDLKDWSRKQSKFVKLEDGESMTLQYEGFDIIPSKFDPEKQSIRYKFSLNGDKKFWENGTQKVALQFDNIKTGSIVKVTRKGLEKATSYAVEVIDAAI